MIGSPDSDQTPSKNMKKRRLPHVWCGALTIKANAHRKFAVILICNAKYEVRNASVGYVIILKEKYLFRNEN